MAAVKKQCFFFFCIFCIDLNLHLSSFNVGGFTNDYKFRISVMNITSKHSNLKFCSPFCYFIDCSKMARIRINTRSRTEEKPYTVLIYIFCKIDKAKKVNRVSKIRVFMLVRYVLKEFFFLSFPWRLKNVKSKSKYPFFQMSAILKSDCT